MVKHNDPDLNMAFREEMEGWKIHRQTCFPALTLQQEEIVRQAGQSAVTRGRAGSGKTTLLLLRAGYLIFNMGIPPQQIGLLTCHAPAVRHLRDRFSALFGQQLAEKLFFGTVQELAQCFLSDSHEEKNILSQRQREVLIGEILTEQGIAYPTDDDLWNTGKALHLVHQKRIPLRAVGDIPSEIPGLAEIVRDYETRLREMGMPDSDGVTEAALALLQKDSHCFLRRFGFLLVDEAQELSPLQREFLLRAKGGEGCLYLTGDENQCLYTSSGADPEGFRSFVEEDGFSAFELTVNYRNAAPLAETLEAFLSPNCRISPFGTVAEEGAENIRRYRLPGRRQQESFLLKILSEAAEQTAVLTPTGESAVPLMDSLLREDIPFRTSGEELRLFHSRVYVCVKAFFRLMLDPFDVDAFGEIYMHLFHCVGRDFYELMRSVQKREQCLVTEAARIVSYESREAEAVRQLLQLASLPSEKALRRFYTGWLSRTKEGRSREMMEQLAYLAAREPEQKRFLERLECLPELIRSHTSATGVMISSIAAAKGTEYDIVYLTDVLDGIFPHWVPGGSSGSHAPAEGSAFTSLHPRNVRYREERRLLAAGVSKARRQLVLLSLEGTEQSFVDELCPPFLGMKPEGEALLEQAESFYVGSRVVIPGFGWGTVAGIRETTGYDAVVHQQVTVGFSKGRTYGFDLSVLIQNGLIHLI